MKRNLLLGLALLMVAFLQIQCGNENKVAKTDPVPSTAISVAPPDSLGFGDTKWISNGLRGKIYLLPENTSKLPLFDTIESVGTIFTKTLNIPTRSWESGFPGVPRRIEWFAIEYKSNFIVRKPSHYRFLLTSDDGARLYIDNKLVVDNDGLHSTTSAGGECDLNSDDHTVTVQYYQGPRNYIALQLFSSLDKEEEQVFPGNYFVLTTPGSSYTWLYIVLAILLATGVAGYLNVRRKKK